MLPHTFRHIPGIGLKTEQRLWSSGLLSWDDFVWPYPVKLLPDKMQLIGEYVQQSRERLEHDPLYFTELLATNQHWRIFPHFRHSIAYFDIETTGLDAVWDQITTIALYDGKDVRYYIAGRNLEDFVEDLNQYDLLVTYNGKTFDLPFVERAFNISINKAHIDLRYVLRSLGFSGGLKRCEEQLGLDRGDLAGVDGYCAVLLWQEYVRSGNERALETLLAYNIEDVVNLENLMVQAYNLSLAKTPFYDECKLAIPESPDLPFVPDRELIAQISRSHYYGRLMAHSSTHHP